MLEDPIAPPHISPAVRSHSSVRRTPTSKANPTHFTSQVILTVFANLGTVPATSILPNNKEVYVDVIFSIKPNASVSGLQVKKLTLMLPVVIGGSSSGSETVLFTQRYDGPGALMLGNNRFQPTLSTLTNILTGQSYLVITIQPRAVSGLVSFASNRDFSCLLRQVAVDTTTDGSVGVTLAESYEDSSGSDCSYTGTTSVPKQPVA